MMKSTIRFMATAFMRIALPLAAGVAAIWLAGELRVFGLLMLSTAIVAGLVLYFDWRGKWLRQILVELDGHQDLDKAA